MDKNLISIIIIIAALFLLTAFTIARQNAKDRGRFSRNIKEQWGKVPARTFTSEEYESIRHYSEDQKSSFTVDDITWHDLDLDSVYRKADACSSSCGDSVLYDMMRHPVSIPSNEDTLNERNRLAEFFDTHEQERIRMQMILTSLGRMRALSIYDYVTLIREAEPIGIVKFAVLAALTLADIVWIFFYPLGGVLGLIPLIAINIAIYLRMKDSTQLYIRSFQCVLRLCVAADSIRKMNLPEISDYSERMKTAAASLASFRRGSVLVTSAGAYSNGILDAILEYVKLLFHVDLMKFDQMLKAYRGHEDACISLITDIGTLDACLAVASYRKVLPHWCRPEFSDTERPAPSAFMDTKKDIQQENSADSSASNETEDQKADLLQGDCPAAADSGTLKDAQNDHNVSALSGSGFSLSMTKMIHPLIEKPVANSLSMHGGNLITGSNASGKSTFLKNVAISVILAQSLDTVPANDYCGPFFRVMTSMALADNLQGGESYFIVEIKSLKRILDASEDPTPLLVIIDEVLRGTNTIERIAASSQILKSLKKENVLAFAATHDIELSYILDHDYTNWHFEEEVGEHDVIFSYLLKEGRATTRNAIKLLEVMNYDPDIVKGARKEAERFEKTGEWRL